MSTAFLLYVLPKTISTYSHPNMSASIQHDFKYETVTGIFLQADPATDHATFDYVSLPCTKEHLDSTNVSQTDNFGLIPRDYPTDVPETHKVPAWQRLAHYIQHLNTQSPASISYKLLYMGRHGEGDHNVAEAFYGTKAWDDHWSKLEGNGTVIWADAHLTEIGKKQALTAHAFMESQLSKHQMPAPQSYYVSPMYRCLQTASLTWSGLELPSDRPFAPVIKELVREVLGEHTCDRRSTKTFIHAEYPEWRIEPGFTEHDELWQANHRETHEEHDVRTREFLRDLFSNDENVYLSLASHSGAIASHLRVLGHREFGLPTGGMIPVLVKATQIDYKQ